MHRFVLTGLLSVLFAAAGGAQDRPILTEAEYLSALNEAHPAVREATEAVALAEAGVAAASTFENPVLGAVREDTSGPDLETEIQISWQLPDAARRTRIDALELETEAVKARFAQQLLTHRIAMREAYAAWAIADDRQHRLAAQAERVESLAEREAARAEMGESSGLEAHRLRLTAIALRSRVALTAAESERARSEVATWYLDLADEVRPRVPDLSSLRSLRSLSGSNNQKGASSLVGPSAQVRAAEASLLAAKLAREAAGRFVRSPELSLGWKRQEVGPETVEGPIVGLVWSLPLFDRNRAARDAAEASLEGAQARLERVEREASVSREAAQKSFEQLSASLAQARQALAFNEHMLDGAEAAFRQGETSLTDLLETHRSVTEAELAMLDLHEAALAAHRELERLVGPTEASQP